MNTNDANKFFEAVVNGTDGDKTIELESSSGRKLKDVKMSPVSKGVLASVIERLPESMFGVMEEVDDPDEAEERLEEEEDMSLDVVTEETVGAFEDLVAESLSHSEFTDTSMRQIVEALDFPLLFELGGQIIELSFESSGDIKDFHEQA